MVLCGIKGYYCLSKEATLAVFPFVNSGSSLKAATWLSKSNCSQAMLERNSRPARTILCTGDKYWGAQVGECYKWALENVIRQVLWVVEMWIVGLAAAEVNMA